MNRIVTLAALVLLMILWTQMSRADGEFRGLDAARDGSGTLRIADKNDEALKRASITLDAGGTASLEFTGRIKWDLSGHWSSRPDNTIELRLDRGLGLTNVQARGTLVLRGDNDFTSVRLEGDSDGRTFDIAFDAERSYSIPVQRFDVDDNGRGTLTMFGRSDESLDRASIKLNQDGTAEIRFNGKDTLTLTGRWNAESNEVLTLDIDRAFGNGGSGSGHVYLGNGMRIDRFEIQGASGIRKYKLDFTYPGRTDDHHPSPERSRIETMDKRLAGTGNFQIGRRHDLIAHANVDLRRGGAAMIHLFGHDTWTVEGTWKQSPGNRIDVVIKRLNDSAADGSAMVHLDDKDAFDRVEVSGKSRGDQFAIDFTTPTYSGGGGGGGGGGITIRSMDLLRTGTGRLSVGRDPEIDIVRANVDLRTNGDAMIKVFEQGLFSNGSTWTLTGRWSKGRGDTIDLDIRRFGNDGATGTGRVTLNGREDFSRVEITARRGGDRIDLAFDVENSTDQQPIRGSVRSMDVLEPGSGRFTMSRGREYSLSKVNVDLGTDGGAMIKVFSAQLGGTKSWELLGRWTQDRDGTVLVTIENALDDKQASGRGRVYLRSDTKFDRIEIDGHADRDDFSVTFRAD